MFFFASHPRIILSIGRLCVHRSFLSFIDPSTLFPQSVNLATVMRFTCRGRRPDALLGCLDSDRNDGLLLSPDSEPLALQLLQWPLLEKTEMPWFPELHRRRLHSGCHLRAQNASPRGSRWSGWCSCFCCVCTHSSRARSASLTRTGRGLFCVCLFHLGI